MTAEGHKVASLHGAKDASERDAIIDGYREGKDKVFSPLPPPFFSNAISILLSGLFDKVPSS